MPDSCPRTPHSIGTAELRENFPPPRHFPYSVQGAAVHEYDIALKRVIRRLSGPALQALTGFAI
jgi:hypothetical protein